MFGEQIFKIMLHLIWKLVIDPDRLTLCAKYPGPDPRQHLSTYTKQTSKQTIIFKYFKSVSNKKII